MSHSKTEAFKISLEVITSYYEFFLPIVSMFTFESEGFYPKHYNACDGVMTLKNVIIITVSFYVLRLQITNACQIRLLNLMPNLTALTGA